MVLSDRPPSPKPDYRTKPDYAVKILDYVEVIPADQPQEQGSSGKSEREKRRPSSRIWEAVMTSTKTIYNINIAQIILMKWKSLSKGSINIYSMI